MSSGNELDIQRKIVSAVKYFFTCEKYHFNFREEQIVTNEPGNGGQTHNAEDFGRKPYDAAIYVPNTIVLFFEVKERKKTGAIHKYKEEQSKQMLLLAANNVDIRYIYNTWVFGYMNQPSVNDVLEKAHVRNAADMKALIKILSPIHPAMTLENYLIGATSQESQRLATVLDSKANLIDVFKSMPLMILANLDPENAKIIIDYAPSGALKLMKELFTLPIEDREKKLKEYSGNKNEKELRAMADAIFDMKNEWIKEKKISLRI